MCAIRSFVFCKVALASILFFSDFFTVKSQVFVQSEDYLRQTGIAVENCADAGGGSNVGWIDNGDWMEYELDVPMDGEYLFNVRIASQNGGGQLRFTEGAIQLGDLSIPATGGWQSWRSIKSNSVLLTRGSHIIRLSAISGGFNINWFEINLVQPEDLDKPSTPVIIAANSDVHTVELKWNTCTDATSLVSGYKLYNKGQFLAYTRDTELRLSKIAPETTLDLQLFACDIAGNMSNPAALTIATTPITWELVWNDEFEGTEVDRNKWNFEVGGHGWGNGEAQYYTDGANSSVKDGCLIIEARQETIGSNSYTSSRMNNGGKGSFRYGRVEVRAKLPSTGGTWPAIWTLPTEWVYGNWPHCGEIDIMEHRGNYLNHVFGTIHTGAYNHIEGTQKSGGKMINDVVNSFHVYALEWYPDHLDWYYDDELIFTFDNEYKSTEEWPFDIEHHVMLNLAIGGGLGGNIDHNGVWPQQMFVDYVRIYDFNLGDEDIIAPTAPSEIKAEISGITVDLSWNISTDNEYVEHYCIFSNGELIDLISGSLYSVKHLEPLTEYTFEIQAKDFAGNYSQKTGIMVTTGDVKRINVPGRFEAEDYLYSEGMEHENCTDAGGGINLAYIDPGDWLEYRIEVQNEGYYFLNTRAASLISRGEIQLFDDMDVLLTNVVTPITGGWQNWVTTKSGLFYLDTGTQFIKIKAKSSEFNLNWFELLPEIKTGFDSNVLVESSLVYPNPSNGDELFMQLGFNNPVEVSIGNMAGIVVYQLEIKKHIGDIKLTNLNLLPGVYIVLLKTELSISSHKIIVE